jgi:hypothetical protein
MSTAWRDAIMRKVVKDKPGGHTDYFTFSAERRASSDRINGSKA